MRDSSLVEDVCDGGSAEVDFSSDLPIGHSCFPQGEDRVHVFLSQARNIASPQVFDGSHRFKVIRVDASCVPTQVVEVHPSLDRASFLHPEGPVCPCFPPPEPKFSVPVLVDVVRPDVAWGLITQIHHSVVRLREETFGAVVPREEPSRVSLDNGCVDPTSTFAQSWFIGGASRSSFTVTKGESLCLPLDRSLPSVGARSDRRGFATSALAEFGSRIRVHVGLLHRLALRGSGDNRSPVFYPVTCG